MALLIPKKVPHRKVRKGKNNGIATRCNTVAFGEFGLMSMGNERITSRQIEAARQAITRYLKRGGKVWIRIFPHTPVSKKPLDVKAGTVMFEVGCVTEEKAREALRLASYKLPVKCKILKKEEF